MIRPYDSLMLRVLLGPLIASLQIFGIYVVFHGHYSPGGGFQGGVILGASLVLPMLVHGHGKGYFVLSEKGALALGALGVLVYAGTGILSLWQSGAFLDYGSMPAASDLDPAMLRSYGILIVEIGVTMAVAGAVVSLIYSLNSPPNEEMK